MCVCVCVCKRERERECVCVCVCVCARARATGACLHTHMPACLFEFSGSSLRTSRDGTAKGFKYHGTETLTDAGTLYHAQDRN